MNAGQRLNQLSVIKRREKAAARRARVKALRDQGLTGPQIAEELGVKVRLVRHDFSVLNREAQNGSMEN